MDHLATFLRAHLSSTVTEICQAYLDQYSSHIEAMDRTDYRGLGFALSNHHEKANCNFVNTISAMFALCNCSSDFRVDLVNHLTKAEADVEFLNGALEAARTGHVILATILFVSSVRKFVNFDIEFVGINREKAAIERNFTESHPLLDEVSTALISRFDEVAIIRDARRKRLLKKIARLKGMPKGTATDEPGLLERYFQWVYHVCSLGLIWRDDWDPFHRVSSQGLTDPAYDATGIVPEPFTVQGYVTNVIQRLNLIDFPIFAQPAVASGDPKFVMVMVLCNLLSDRNIGLQLEGVFRNRRKLKSVEEIPNTGKVEFLTAAAMLEGIGHTYAVVIKGEKLCVVNGFSVILTYRPMRDFALFQLCLLERFGGAGADDVDQ
jgi:hypothetical protein